MIHILAVAFHEALRRRTGGFRAFWVFRHLPQELRLVEILVIQYVIVPYLQPKGNPLKTPVPEEIRRQLAAAVHHNLIAHPDSYQPDPLHRYENYFIGPGSSFYSVSSSLTYSFHYYI